jgi:hypothetical protein
MVSKTSAVLDGAWGVDQPFVLTAENIDPMPKKMEAIPPIRAPPSSYQTRFAVRGPRLQLR